jgi:hypothetical protein
LASESFTLTSWAEPGDIVDTSAFVSAAIFLSSEIFAFDGLCITDLISG